MRKRRSLRRDIALIAPVLLLVVLLVALVPQRMNAQIERHARDRADGLAGVLASALAASLEFDDPTDAERVLRLLTSQEDAESAVLVDASGRVFARWARGTPHAHHLDAVAPVRAAGGTSGRLVLRFDADPIAADRHANWLASFSLVVIGGGALAAMVAWLLMRRRRAERALADEEAKFSTLVEGMPDGLLVYRRGELAYANSAARRLLQLGGADAQGLAGTSEALATVDAAIEHSLARTSGLPEASRVVEVSGSGGTVHLDVRAFALTIDGDPVTLSLARDVTEERQLRDRLVVTDRLAAIGTLATGVAHEINNPLTYILSNLEFVENELAALEGPRAPTPAALAELDAAVHEAQLGAIKVQRIVKDMRKMARKDFGERNSVELRGVIKAVVDLAVVAVGQRARFELDLAPVPPVLASESQLSQVLLNLLVNAADAIPTDAPPERRQVTISTRPAPGGSVELAVADRGSGIPPEVRSKIFDPFFTTKPVGVGTGLGLAICHGIVRAHGGSIHVDTEIDRGTTMRVILPAAEIDVVPGAPVPELPARRPGRVLVVDDERPIVTAAARLLDRGTTEVETSARRALERMAAGERFDLILCDVRMPDMNGPELLDALRGRAPEQARAFAFMTGALDERAEADLARLGAPVLEKPFDGETLRTFVHAQLTRLRRPSA